MLKHIVRATSSDFPPFQSKKLHVVKVTFRETRMLFCPLEQSYYFSKFSKDKHCKSINLELLLTCGTRTIKFYVCHCGYWL